MPKQFPTEFRDCAVRMTMDRLSEYPSVHAACKALAPKLGVGPESLRRWVVQAQVDAGEKSGPSSEELEEIKRRYPKTSPTGGMIPGTVHSLLFFGSRSDGNHVQHRRAAQPTSPGFIVHARLNMSAVTLSHSQAQHILGKSKR